MVDKYYDENISIDLETILGAARLLAISLKHNFLHYDHVFAAMLEQPCLAQQFIPDIDISLWLDDLRNYPQAEEYLPEDADIILTVELERLVLLSQEFAYETGDGKTNSIYLLLAMLSYNNKVCEAVKKRGITFADVSHKAFLGRINKRQPKIVFEKLEPYSMFQKFFLSESYIKKRIQELENEVAALYNYEDFDTCTRICEVALSLEQNNPFFVEYIAYSHLANRKFTDALPWFEKLLASDAENLDYNLNMATILEGCGNHTSAFEILDRLIEKHPGNATILNNKGFYLSSLNQNKDAIFLLEQAHSIAPDWAYPLNNLGFAKYQHGDIESGLQLIERSLEIDKGNAYAYRNKGIIYMAMEKIEQAKENFNLALKFGFEKLYGDEVTKILRNLKKSTQ